MWMSNPSVTCIDELQERICAPRAFYVSVVMTANMTVRSALRHGLIVMSKTAVNDKQQISAIELLLHYSHLLAQIASRIIPSVYTYAS
jgi:hypothetical protein